mgnify:CR=1 FL=1
MPEEVLEAKVKISLYVHWTESDTENWEEFKQKMLTDPEYCRKKVIEFIENNEEVIFPQLLTDLKVVQVDVYA